MVVPVSPISVYMPPVSVAFNRDWYWFSLLSFPIPTKAASFWINAAARSAVSSSVDSSGTSVSLKLMT